MRDDLCQCFFVLCECYTVFHQSNISPSCFVSLLTSLTTSCIRQLHEKKGEDIDYSSVRPFALSFVFLSLFRISLFNSFVRLFVRSFILSFVHSFRHFVHSSFGTFGRPFVSSFVLSFLRSSFRFFVLSFLRFAKVRHMSNLATGLFDCISILLDLHSTWSTVI